MGLAGLARLGDGADRFADDSAQHHEVAVRGLHARDLGREIGGAALEAGLLAHLHARSFQSGLGATQHLQAEFIVLVDRADLLGALFLGQLWHAQAHLVVVGGGKGIFQSIQWLIHLTRGRHREEADHVLVEQHRKVATFWAVPMWPTM